MGFGIKNLMADTDGKIDQNTVMDIEADDKYYKSSNDFYNSVVKGWQEKYSVETTDDKAVFETTETAPQPAETSSAAAAATDAGTASSEAQAENTAPAAAGKNAVAKDVEETVKAIRDIYNTTNSGSYTNKNGKVYNGNVLIKASIGVENQVIKAAMDRAGYQKCSIEYYYTNPDAYAAINGYQGLVFAFLVIDGREYRYYFDGNEHLIRRIGPDGQQDRPETNWFAKAVYDAGAALQYIR
jgi:hypothetical protein